MVQDTATRIGVAALMREATGALGQSHLRILRSVEDVYREVAIFAAMDVVAGQITRRDGAQRALDAFAMRGVTGFTDRAGRNWDLASYAEMVTRTTAGRASVQAHSERLQANGRDLVIVSAHGGCPLCSPWEGRVLSLSGTDPEHPSLDEAEGAGLYHVACRHSHGIFIPGLTEPLEAPAGAARNYELSQQQRSHERAVRTWKRREAVALDDVTRARASGKVGDWQARLRDLVESNPALRRHYERESITRAR